MSHFIFGTFCLDETKKYIVEDLKEELSAWGIILTVNEFPYFEDISRMLNENLYASDVTKFALSSVRQPYNSDDILYPYDKYSNQELFDDSDNQIKFKELCLNHLNVLKKIINTINDNPYTTKVQIMISEGYDNHFLTQYMTVEEMVRDIYSQVISSFSLESKIYLI